MANEVLNIHTSHYKRIAAQLSGETIVYPGSEVPTRGISNYFNVAYPEIQDAPMSRAALIRETWRYLIDCIANTGTDGEDSYKVAEMADKVRAAFHQVDYNLQDWAGDDSVLGVIRCSKVRIEPIPTGSSEQSKLTCIWTGFIVI